VRRTHVPGRSRLPVTFNHCPRSDPFRGLVPARHKVRPDGAGTPAEGQRAGTAVNTTLPVPILARAPISMLPKMPAPAAIITPSRIFGWRSPCTLPVPPRVTPWSMETPSSTTAVSPITTPVPWSIIMPRPSRVPKLSRAATLLADHLVASLADPVRSKVVRR